MKNLYWIKLLQLKKLNDIFYLRSCAVHSKPSQIDRAQMANLKTIHLKEVDRRTFELFQRYGQTQEIRFLNDLFRNAGHEMRMAGGAVRDLLINKPPHDIDFASDANPDQMIALLSNRPEVRLITTLSGIKHGTITARINNKCQFEITTLRIDQNTDGRHAEVEFINDWKLDASRRDLTINSMFIDSDGLLYDYFGGMADLKDKKIRFVGDPSNRIVEDYLRIFRYFRFHIRYGKPGDHEQSTLMAIKSNLEGLRSISGERIWSEMKRILSNLSCDDAINVMFKDLEMGKYLGFSNKKIDFDEFERIHSNLLKLYSTNNSNIVYNPETLFASLINGIDDLIAIVSRLKLSNLERDIIIFIISNRSLSIDYGQDERMFKTQIALASKSEQINLKKFIIQFLLYQGYSKEFIENLNDWIAPSFPFKGTRIPGTIKKQNLKLIIDDLKKIWAKNNFEMTEEEFDNEILRLKSLYS
ncbi:CCA tRNA nucleotidyltransferase 1 [Sarcoptes scabiei]|uniref:CCA tRNA nucleotidyltransferase 1, mitochondrial n=2 Tax=Sarcoptes scabiei TaxID=52283 RepID=A0A834R6V2_SARSC|nr:CCA tRNA nucleotidyltransferase 1 [Sarcoptes scabiei]